MSEIRQLGVRGGAGKGVLIGRYTTRPCFVTETTALIAMEIEKVCWCSVAGAAVCLRLQM